MNAAPQPHPPQRMTADEFIAWAVDREFRGELVGGEVVAMAPERHAHARAKGAAFRALGDAAARAGCPCEVLVDGMAVRVDEETIYQPDVVLRCGPPLEDDALEVPDPLLLVEVVSPSTSRLDTGGKLDGYFRIATVRHYLILSTRTRTVILHTRDTTEGPIATRILRDGALALDPPGILLDVPALFGGPPPGQPAAIRP
jgi:Uma2 family endonuclease